MSYLTVTSQAEPTNRDLTLSSDSWAREEWKEDVEIEGVLGSRFYLFSNEDITWDDGSVKDAESYPFDETHVSRVIVH